MPVAPEAVKGKLALLGADAPLDGFWLDRRQAGRARQGSGSLRVPGDDNLHTNVQTSKPRIPAAKRSCEAESGFWPARRGQEIPKSRIY